MKHILPLLITILYATITAAQVGINNTDPQAALDISTGVAPSNTDGILIPRVDEYPTGMTAAQDGMLVFLTGSGIPTKGFYYYSDGVGWLPLIGSGGTNNLDQAYDQGGNGAGATIEADSGAVSIEGEDGFQITGTFGSGNDVVLTGAGTRLFFSPKKGAFRAGRVNHTQWDHAFIGDYSFAAGRNTIAFGENSIAMGFDAGSYNPYATAIGFNVGANANNAIALGSFVTASSYGETALGLFGTNQIANSTTSIDLVDRLFSIGNGTDISNRKNALTIFKNGLLNINEEYNMPLVDGAVSQVMTTDGAGNLSFQNDETGDDWTITGNSGTNPSTNFIGTTDIQDFSIRTENTEKVRITTQGQIETYNTGQSVFIGEEAGENDDLSNNQNVAIGFNALQTNSISNKNVAVGFQALKLSTTDSNTAVGWNALSLSTTGTQNTGIGYAALRKTTTGRDNTALGYQALNDNTIGFGNTAAGRISLNKNIGGNYNTANGFLSLSANTNGDENTAIGFNALSGNITGEFNAAIGSRAGLISKGDNNTYLGFRAGDSDDIATENVYVGAFAGGGNYSGVTMTGQENKNGNIFMGFRAGYNENGSNKLYIENSDSATPLLYGEFDTNILRTYGALQIGDPVGTGYTLPTADGAANQVITSNGDGTTQWSSPSTPAAPTIPMLTNLNYPDGFTGLTPITIVNLQSTPYTIPTGKNLYISNYYNGGTSAGILTINGSIICYGPHNFRHTTITKPIIGGAGDIIATGNNSSSINGFLVDATTTPLTILVAVSSSYTVPTGKTLILLSGRRSANVAGGLIMTIDGDEVYRGTGNAGALFTNEYMSAFQQPFFVGAGSVLTAVTGQDYNINGYLIDN